MNQKLYYNLDDTVDVKAMVDDTTDTQTQLNKPLWKIRLNSFRQFLRKGFICCCPQKKPKSHSQLRFEISNPSYPDVDDTFLIGEEENLYVDTQELES
jgi:hypothetical protein